MPTWNYVVLTVTLCGMIGVTTQCDFSELQLINGSAPNEGVVEVCIRNEWSSVCAAEGNYMHNWGTNEATVVCRQLGYEGPIGIQPPPEYRDQFQPTYRSYALRNVYCSDRDPVTMTLLECFFSSSYNINKCYHARVRCMESQRVKNVKAVLRLNRAVTAINTVIITWEQNTTVAEPNMFEVKCYNDRHSIEITMSIDTTTTELGGLLHSSNYTCCVSAVYDLYTARSVCTEVETPTNSVSAPSTSNSSTVVGGVLGFIIILLLVLLAVSVVCLLRPALRKKVLPTKLSQFIDSNSKSSSTLPVRANVSYITTPSSHSATENSSQNNRATDQGVTASSNPNYSSIGPAYETLSNTTVRQQRQGGREIPISERYEFAEIHTDTDRRVQVGVSASDYEVPRESVHIGDEEYSHLQH